MRSTKSNRSVKRPFFSRSAIMASTTLAPKPFMPERAKRMSPFLLTVKWAELSLTSGLRTLILWALLSSMIFLISSMLLAHVRQEAMNSEV